MIGAYNDKAGTAGVSPMLLFDNRILDEAIQVQDLNVFHDDIVILRAALPTSPRAVAARAFPLIIAASLWPLATESGNLAPNQQPRSWTCEVAGNNQQPPSNGRENGEQNSTM